MDVVEGTTPDLLIRELDIPKKLKMVAYVNGKRRDLNQGLEEGDEVKLATLLGGG
jgi:hypothetical protein